MKPGEHTVLHTAEFIAEASGLEVSHLRTVSRKLREADLLSQFGRGRGAAAATPRDAALLLLVSALAVSPLRAVLIGNAVLDCTVGTMTDDETEDRPVEGSVLGHVTGLIATGKDADLIHIMLGDDLLSVIVAEGRVSFNYQMPEGSPVRRKLAAKFGRRGKLARMCRGEYREGVLAEISAYLGIEAEKAEAAA